MIDKNDNIKYIKIISFIVDERNYGCRLIQLSFQNFICNIMHDNIKIEFYDTRKIYDRKLEAFQQFEKENFNFKQITTINDIVNDIFDTQFFIIPGDQEWNFNCRNIHFFHKFFSMDFIPENKKFVYSISDNDWFNYEDTFRDEYIKKISKIENISVREDNTARILKQHFKRLNIHQNVSSYIDTVFLMSKDYWISFAKKPSNIKENENFNFVYYVHMHESITITGNTYKCYGDTSDKCEYSLNEWVWMILHCNKLYTNSYHGFVFFILLNNNGEIFLQNKFDYRITSLSERLNIDLHDKKIQNFDTINNLISYEVLRSQIYLKFMLGISKTMRFYGYSKEYRNVSASGGISAQLAKYVIDNNGIVYGASYCSNFKSVKTIRIETFDEYLSKISKSKYSFCINCDFQLVKNDLEQNRIVMFSGCPCQIKDLLKYLGKTYSNLLTVDLLCHGYSTSNVLQNFVDQQEKCHNSRVISIDMRYNHQIQCQLKFENGDTQLYDNIVSTFINQKNMCDICKQCNMHYSNNKSDITLGDFWEYRKYTTDNNFFPENGTNIIRLNTKNGMFFFNEILKNLEIRCID